MKKISHANSSNEKKAGVALLIAEKRDFELKTITRDKEGDYLLIRGSTHEEDITIMDTYIPDNRTSKYVKQKWTELNGETVPH